jgi:hypothetical protein
MVNLISRESHQIKFPGGTLPARLPVLPPVTLTVTVETGVVVFTLLGTNPHDWTRDTLAFPVGAAAPSGDFISGIASAAPTSFWTPMNNVAISGGGQETAPVLVGGTDGNGSPIELSGSATVALPGVPVPPPVGFAIDAAEVAYSTSAGQPVLTLALAVFGNCAAMLRASYTAYIINGSGGVVVVGNK